MKQKKQYKKTSLILAFTFLGGCTAAPDSNISIILSAHTSKASLNSNLPPHPQEGFNFNGMEVSQTGLLKTGGCYFVHVTGPDINDPRYNEHDNDNSNECPAGVPELSGLGILPEKIYSYGADVNIAVPSGPDRQIDLVGFTNPYSNDPNCEKPFRIIKYERQDEPGKWGAHFVYGEFIIDPEHDQNGNPENPLGLLIPATGQGEMGFFASGFKRVLEPGPQTIELVSIPWQQNAEGTVYEGPQKYGDCGDSNTGGGSGSFAQSDFTGRSGTAGESRTEHMHFQDSNGNIPGDAITSFSITSTPPHAEFNTNSTWVVPVAEPQAVDLSFTVPPAGSYTLHMTVNGDAIADVTYTSNAAIAVDPDNSSLFLSTPQSYTGTPSYIDIDVRDGGGAGMSVPLGNIVVTHDGAPADITLLSIHDLGAGVYRQVFSPNVPGSYYFNATVNGTTFTNSANLTIVNSTSPIIFTGIKGGSDSTADNLLTDPNGNPTIYFTDHASEDQYWVSVYNSDNGNFICDNSSVATNSTSAAVTGCGFFPNGNYHVVVTAMNSGSPIDEGVFFFTVP